MFVFRFLYLSTYLNYYSSKKFYGNASRNSFGCLKQELFQKFLQECLKRFLQIFHWRFFEDSVINISSPQHFPLTILISISSIYPLGYSPRIHLEFVPKISSKNSSKIRSVFLYRFRNSSTVIFEDCFIWPK